MLGGFPASGDGERGGEAAAGGGVVWDHKLMRTEEKRVFMFDTFSWLVGGMLALCAH